MASPILHIKDSYYFEVPKALWRVDYSKKEEFPDVWVRLDADFQLWEADRLYPLYKELKGGGEVPSLESLKSEYTTWKAEHANAGKPFSRFLEEHHDVAWAKSLAGNAATAARWAKAKAKTGDERALSEYKRSEGTWSAEKLAAYNRHLSGKILIPQLPGGRLRNLYEREFGFCISKFMVLEVAVALVLCLAFGWLARCTRGGGRPRGRMWNLLEVFVVFIRDQIARPAIGKHDADRFVPLLMTFFFFILGCNLTGMIPWLGAPTGSWGVTLGLASITFGTLLLAGMGRFGPLGFFLNLAPKIELPMIVSLPIILFILVIEVLGLCIRHAILSVRLLANMVAGHIVLLAIMMLAFSVQGAASPNWSITAVIAVFGSTAFSCLELFVAFLQAYIFTFLSALFIGSAIHHH